MPEATAITPTRWEGSYRLYTYWIEETAPGSNTWHGLARFSDPDALGMPRVKLAPTEGTPTEAAAALEAEIDKVRNMNCTI